MASESKSPKHKSETQPQLLRRDLKLEPNEELRLMVGGASLLIRVGSPGNDDGGPGGSSSKSPATGGGGPGGSSKSPRPGGGPGGSSSRSPRPGGGPGGSSRSSKRPQQNR